MFQGLGTLSPQPAVQVVARGISADGRVVVGGTSSAFRWTAETGIQSLGFSGSANDVSSDGSVIVGLRAGRAVRWTEGTGAVELGTLPGGEPARNAVAVSGDGNTIVGTSFAQSFLWTQAGGFQMIDGGAPSNISQDGSVVVGTVPGTTSPPQPGVPVTQWARWTANDGWQGLPELPGPILLQGSAANAVTADGMLIVGRAESHELGSVPADAVVWSEAGGTESLGFSFDGEALFLSQAMAVSADGSVIAGLIAPAAAPGDSRAFIWDAANGLRYVDELLTNLGLDVSDWVLREVVGLSADGLTLTGNGLVDEEGIPRQRAWIAVIPEPSTGALLGAGLVALARRRRA
jgi:uncharacterized membrane protein